MALPQIGIVKYHTVIPSTGETIEFRPYTVKEEKALLLALETKDQLAQVSAVKDLIQNCTLGNIKADSIAMFDFEYLFLQIRSKSVGEIANLGVKCSSCDASNKVDIELDKIEVKGDIKPSTKVMLTDSVGVMVSYPKVKGVMRQLKGNSKKTTDYEQTLNIIASCIDSIFDEESVYDAGDHTPAELLAFVESLSASQFKEILSLFNEMPTLKEEVKFSCSKCSADNSVTLEGLQSFFS